MLQIYKKCNIETTLLGKKCNFDLALYGKKCNVETTLLGKNATLTLHFWVLGRGK